ncbi:MAG: hypothetical protein VZR31_07075 [Lachnospiraceae bacterium]|nr:hypothetical protein [Lachnospiraceae bacterium]
MSIWSDIEDRSAGESMRKEDMQKTINDLTEEIKQLQEANRKLAEQLKDVNRYFHKSSDVVWYSDWNDEDEHKGIGSIFKF